MMRPLRNGSPVAPSVRRAVDRALAAGGEALTAMIDRSVSMTAPLVELVPLRAVPGLAGSPDRPFVAIYLGISGDFSGHLVFLLSEPSALNLMAALLAERPASAATMTELQRSALAEVGNVSGSAFLNALADAARMRIVPSAPLIVCDMAGAILDGMLADIGRTTDRALVIHTRFSAAGAAAIAGYFLLLPDADGLARVCRALEAESG